MYALLGSEFPPTPFLLCERRHSFRLSPHGSLGAHRLFFFAQCRPGSEHKLPPQVVKVVIGWNLTQFEKTRCAQAHGFNFPWRVEVALAARASNVTEANKSQDCHTHTHMFLPSI